MSTRPASWWTSLDADNAEFAARIRAELGLTVRGFCHGHKPEFDEGVTVDWPRVEALATGQSSTPSLTQSVPVVEKSSPAQKKTIPKRKNKRGVK